MRLAADVETLKMTAASLRQRIDMLEQARGVPPQLRAVGV